ncbi:MAG TPA: hypothetical protein VFK43_22475 [Acidimicrobiales bacterium]|nr:hypothetical protein [Acidimicrobiales bacterium]
MIKTRTARKFLATASLAAAAFAGFGGIAGADTIAPAPQPGPGPVIANPQPEPHPAPAPQPEQPPIAQPEADPEPDPQPADLPIAQPEDEPGHGPGDIAQPSGGEDPEPDPEVPTGADDLADDPCNHLTHGCVDDSGIDDLTDTPRPDGHCFDDAGNVLDPADCLPGEDGEEPKDGGDSSSEGTEVEGSTLDRGALPRTGAGLALLAGLGTALTAAGAATKRAANR